MTIGLFTDLLRLVLIVHTLVTSEVALVGLCRVLSRKGFFPAQQIEAFLMFLREHVKTAISVKTLELGIVVAIL